jgi:hypothetical protein
MPSQVPPMMTASAEASPAAAPVVDGGAPAPSTPGVTAPKLSDAGAPKKKP